MTDIQKQVGAKVRTLRQQKALTQEQLAHNSRIPRSQLSQIERGLCNVTLVTLQKLVSGLDVQASVFLKGIR